MGKIEKSDIQNIYPLTFVQEGMLFHSLKDIDNSNLYFEQLQLEIEGEIDRSVFEQSWIQLINDNEALRAIFKWEKLSTPVQIILKKAPPAFFYYDFSDQEESQKAKEIEDLKFKDKLKGFKLSEEVPFRITLTKIDNTRYLLMLSSHHILFDGWSNGIIIRQFLDIYDNIQNNRDIEKKFKPVNVLQRFIQEIRNQDKAKQSEYWKKYFSGLEQPTRLGFINNLKTSNRNESLDFDLPEEMGRSIGEYLKTSNTTIAAFFYMVWGLLLQNYLDTNDVVFGTTISGRNMPLPGILDTIGMFINTIPFRLETEKTDSPDDILGKVKEDIYGRIPYENNSLADIQKMSAVSNRKSLFNTIFVVEDYPAGNISGYSLDIKDVSIDEMNNYDLTVTLYHSKNSNIHICINYNTGVFEYKNIAGIKGHMADLIRSILANPYSALEKMDYLPVVKASHGPDSSSSVPMPDFIRLFQEQAVYNPDRVAIICGEEKITYGLLNKKTDDVQRFLKKIGFESSHVAALHLSRSADMIAVIIGVLKTGGLFELIAPDFPKQYTHNLMESSNLVITDQRQLQGKNIVPINELFQSEMVWEKYSVKATNNSNKYESLYSKNQRMYQSVSYLQQKFPVSEDEVFYQCTPYNCFDFTWEMVWCLSNGASLCYPQNDKNTEEIAKELIKYKVSFLRTIPSSLDSLLLLIEEDYEPDDFTALKFVFVDEIPLKPELVQLFDDILYSETSCKLIGLYGCYEYGGYLLFHNYMYSSGQKLYNLIGKPFDESSFKLLNRYDHVQSTDCIGQICVPDFKVSGSNNLIHTGIYVRQTQEGLLQYIRSDTSVIRLGGYNIYPKLIDSYVLKYDGIVGSFTALIKNEGKENVYTYFSADKEIYINSLRNYLKDNIPHYLVPLYFIQVRDVNEVRKKFIDNIDNNSDTTFNVEVVEVAPKSDIEIKIAQIWEKVIGKRVGIHNDFFDVGGDSLNILQVNSYVVKEYNIKIPLSVMFQHPTISTLAQYVQERLDNSTESAGNSNLKEISFYALTEESDVNQAVRQYPVSYAQNQLLLHSEVNDSSIVYNMPLAVKISGDLDIELVKNAFSRLVQRHESLRTSFNTAEGGYVQSVNKSVEFSVSEETIDSSLINQNIASFVQAFDLHKAPLFRVKVLHINNSDNHVLLFDMHHTVSDGLSYKILLNEFNKLYKGKVLPDIKVQYKDFAAWQRRSIESGELLLQEKYWLERFKNGVPAMSFPMDYKRPRILGAPVKKVTRFVDRDDMELITALLQKTKTTLYMFTLSVFHILLSKYSMGTEIVTGTPAAGRRHPDLGDVIGNFVNMIPLWTSINPKMSFAKYLSEVKETAIQAFNNQDYPLELLTDKITQSREPWRNPVFDIVLTFLNDNFSVDEFPGASHEVFELDQVMSKYDLLLTVTERKENGMSLSWEYRTDLFEDKTIEELADKFNRLIKKILAQPEILIEDIDVLSENEKTILLMQNDNSNIKYPTDKTIPELFEEQVKRSPENIAVICGDERWTYDELNKYADKVASLLKNKGVGTESVVGVLLDRSVKMIASLLGVLKAGGGYMPVDPEYPEERKKYMLKDSGAKLLLTERQFLTFSLDGIDLSTVYLDKAELDSQTCENQPTFVSPENMAYIIYTSGSSGEPKGVVIEHKNVVRLFRNDKMLFDFNESDVWSIFHSFCFDFSVWEMYGPLLFGGTGVIISRETARDPAEFWELLKRERVTVLNQTPGSFRNMLSENEDVNMQNHNLRYVIFGGEELQPAMLKEWHEKNPDVSIINMYGITETTVHVTYKEITDKEISGNQCNIGRPIPTLSTYLMDENKKLVPIGTIGEIYVGGEGVARGYINKAELNGERFISNPYKQSERLYKTGDYAKQLKNGELIYCGRKDKQVKVRGHRIELGEIEKILRENQKIKEAVILDTRDENGNVAIAAFIVLKHEISVNEVRTYLTERLPSYMIPSHFVFVDKIPLTMNGKVNKSVLEKSLKFTHHPKIETDDLKDDNETEMYRLWRQVINTDQIDVEDSFFEIGGDSSSIVKLRTLIEQRWQVKISVAELFSHPTVSSMVNLVENKIPC